MDGVAEEVAPLDAASGLRLQSKENEFSVKSASGPPVGSHEMIIPTEPDYCHTSPHHLLGDILEGKILSRSLSSLDPLGHPCASPRSMDDVTGIVEELTVRNYDNLNLAVVGTSSNGDRVHGRTNQWQHLYETSGGSASGSSHRNFVNHAGSSIWEDMACTTFPEHLSHKSQRVDQDDVSQQYSGPENKGIQGANALALNGAIRTKMLSRSGFSEYFIKNTLKGKGVICRGPPVDNYQLEQKIQNNLNIPTGPKVASNPSVNSEVKNIFPLTHEAAGSGIACPNHDGVNLREWLNNGHREINKSERLSIFKQIVQLVDYSHSQATALRELRPSCFKLLPSNQVKYVGSSEVREFPGSIKEKKISNFTSWIAVKRASEPAQLNSRSLSAKKQRFTEDMNYRPWSQFPSKTDIKVQTPSFSENNVSDPRHPHYDYCELNPGADIGDWRSDSHHLATPTEQQLAIVSEPLEEKWYMSPEELNEGVTRVSSNIYSLGVFLFELLGNFTSERARSSALMDLRHRILPPNFLSENPKEAGFCLWLLHPDPASRPSSRKILESEVLSELKDGGKDVNLEELTSSIEQEDTESELLLHFLATMKEQKQKDTSKLVESIRRLESDIEEIGRRYCMGKPSEHSKDFTSSDVIPLLPPISNAKESRWMGKINLLETAYFSMRSRIQLHEMDGSRRVDNDLLRSRDNWSSAQNDELQSPSDQLGDFFEGLCKYARYSKFEVRGVLRNGEFNNSANVICSLSFDRDEDYFATAGVSKKIKIFEFNSLLDQSVDIHYPAIEMSNKSKLSSVCWNNYIRNYLASTDYDGIVKLWDASTGQCFSEYNEHEKRAWTVHFSPVHPTKLASGSDDFSVKLWSINERNCLRTIRNIANVCCVQFSPHSTHLLAFGSADYRTYCYDLRNVRTPWCILAGHEKAVSYVKFLDSGTIITASTDNSLKLWDLQKTSPSGLSANACSLTLTGHTNEKNFVGLSVADGYITCGSETNEVYSYYRSLPMPITSHKFGSIDPISGKEIDDDNGQFVSSVCWRGKSDMLVAANSSGCIKVLQMV